jgi:hypothetical protein
MGHVDAPARLARRGVAGDDVAAGFDEGPRRALRRQHRQRFLEDIALRDAAEVEPHAGAIQPGGSRGRIQFQMAPADACAGIGKLRGARQLS